MRVILLFLLLLLPLFSDHDKRLEDHEKREHIPKNLQALELSKAQHDKLKIILKEHRSKLMALHEEEEKFEEMLREFFKSEKFDKETFLAKKTTLKLKMATIETDFFLKLHGLFNTKQRKLFAQYIEEWEVE